MMNKEYKDILKPCPFCGSKAYEESCDRLIVIGCEECGYNMSFEGLICHTNTGVPVVYEGGIISKTEWHDKDAHKKAYEKWNRRSE